MQNYKDETMQINVKKFFLKELSCLVKLNLNKIVIKVLLIKRHLLLILYEKVLHEKPIMTFEEFTVLKIVKESQKMCFDKVMNITDLLKKNYFFFVSKII